MYGKMQASGLTGFIPFICSSAIWGQPCFPVHLKKQQMAASCIPQLLSRHHGGWQYPLDQFWEPSFTTGDQKSLMAVIFLVYWYGRRYFHFANSWKKPNPEHSCMFFPEMSHHLFLTYSWAPDLGVGFKAGICWWERMDTAFLILLKCSWVN